jgi:transcriptional regulator with XRE-family HTH domain
MRKIERSEFGQRLRDVREKAGLTQKELADLAGFKSQGSIAELEKSGQGSSKTLQLAAACGVTPEYLATGRDKPVAGPWPFLGIVSPEEWALLPDEVREDVLADAEHRISRHRKKSSDQSGKLSDSRDGSKRQGNG